jgi:DNA-binding SARP family transcriptional activator
MTGDASSAQLRLLPAFELHRHGYAEPLPNRAQRLVALLAVAERPLSRAVVASRLWPDVVNARANASLRATLWGFPRESPSPVLIENDTLCLNPHIELDLTAARELATSVIDGTYGCADPDRERNLQEDILPAWTDEWLVIERERYCQLRLHALDLLCVAHAQAGRYARGIAAGLASVASEPTRESAHRAVMTAHLLEGNRMEAIRQYHAYIAMARAEMGIGPSDHLQRLFRQALEDATDDESVTAR